MQASGIFLLVASCVISFALGRTFVHFRDKRRDQRAQERAAQALRERPPEPAARNKSKRKRQLQQIQRGGRPR